MHFHIAIYIHANLKYEIINFAQTEFYQGGGQALDRETLVNK